LICLHSFPHGGISIEDDREIATIGHSTHELDRFVELLRGAGIGALADVRTVPKSRRMPWFWGDALAESLPAAGIAYRHFRDLGGFRRPQPGSPNGGWRVAAFQGYADNMATDRWRAALDELQALAAERRTAVMCAEAQWTRCHRRLVSDALLVRGWTVLHIDSRGATKPHALTPFAVVRDGDHIDYPAEQQSLDV
jgi:uncharacterized protein (DUF488 family)